MSVRHPTRHERLPLVGSLQVWLEFHAGDARLRAMATDHFTKIL